VLIRKPQVCGEDLFYWRPLTVTRRRIQRFQPALLLFICSFQLAFGLTPRRYLARIQANARPSQISSKALYRRTDAPIERRIDDLIARMTLEEKVRQLDLYSGVTFVSKQRDETHAAPDAVFLPNKAETILGNGGVGGIHDLYPSPEQANAIQEWVIGHNRLGIPALFIEEALHGFDTGTVFPAPINLAATWNVDLAERTGAAIAAEVRATGVDMILSPVLDLAREPRWGRVEEDFGEDPYLTGQLGLAYVRGAQGESLKTDHTVVAEPKHFAAHGSPEGGANTSPVHIGERELRTVMLKAFEPALREGRAMAVMAAYHEIDGIPVTADSFLLKNILRDEWEFHGFVLSDLGAIRRLYDVHHVAASSEAAVCMAVRSGVDMQFYDFDHDLFQRALINCVHQGALAEVDLDRAVRSVLRVKFALGLGESQETSGEGRDRSNLDLPGNQGELLEAVTATGKPVVLVLENGRPLTIGGAKEHVPAILEAWYPGEFGGQAIAETLFGDNNPAGRLTITFPRSVGQLPDFYNFDPSRTHKYVDDDGQPLFRFGFGLSYTKFRYDHLVAKHPALGVQGDILVSVDVTNVGQREGDEVVQLYLGHNVSSVETPARSLVGFSRIRLKPLETKTVRFSISRSQIAVWNVSRRWVIEPGNYTLWAGGSSEASLTTEFVLTQ